jgi:hypothetical protein
MLKEQQRVSGALLDWYLVDWTETQFTIDYGIKCRCCYRWSAKTGISLERIGRMPMPIDLCRIY